MKRIGVRELREQLGKRVDGAHFRGEHTVIEKTGEPRAVLVPYDWWVRQGGRSEAQTDAAEQGPSSGS